MTGVKKHIRAVVCMLLSLLLMLTMVSIPASALSISKTSYTLTKGYAVTLSVSGAGSSKVKWTSSDTSVATVSSAGKVVGKKAGNATITADVGGTKVSCALKVVGGKLSLSKSSVEMKEGDVTYVTVRAKGSHGLKAVSGDKGIVTAGWVKPWDGDDIRLKLTAQGAGSTTVKIQLTQYTDIYTNVKVTVKGKESEAELHVGNSSINAKVNEATPLVVYSNKSNSISLSLSDNTVAKVEQGTWKDNYCTLTITGLKAGTTNLTITRTDAPSVKKVIPITITGSAYYTVSDTKPTLTAVGDRIYTWTDSATNRTKYMLVPATYDMATINTAIAKYANKYEYYTVFDESPKSQQSTDKVMTFTVIVDSKSVTRYILVPDANYDQVAYNTALASYTGKFEYYTIYNVSPEKYSNRANDIVKTWTTVVNYKTQTRYMLVPYGYSEAYVDGIIAADGGTSLGGYYGATTTIPTRKEATDKILSFNGYAGTTLVTYYVLVPENYDPARYNDVVATYTGVFEYGRIYTIKPEKISTLDEIQQWTKIIDNKSVTRYVLLPPGYSADYLNNIKNDDLKTQNSSYYVISSTYPTMIDSSTDTVKIWTNPSTNTVRYMLVPKNYDVLKVNDLITKDTGVYEYYAVYSSVPSSRAEGDKVLRFQHNTKGVLYMLVPQNYDQSVVNANVNQLA